MPENTIKQLLQRIHDNDPGVDRIPDVFRLVEEEDFLPTLKLLAEVLKGNTVIKDLRFWLVQLGAQGTQFLAEVLKENNHIETVDLVNCNIGDEGITALAEALVKNTSVKEIRILGEQLTLEGGAALASMLGKNRMIKKLELRLNQISEQSMIDMAVALRTNSTLIHLDLNNNPMTSQAVEAWIETLKINRTLTVLEIEGASREQYTMMANYCILNDDMSYIKTKLLELTPESLAKRTKSDIDREMRLLNSFLQKLVLLDKDLGTEHHAAIAAEIESKKTEIRLLKPDFSIQRMFTSAAHKVARDTKDLFASQPSNNTETPFP